MTQSTQAQTGSEESPSAGPLPRQASSSKPPLRQPPATSNNSHNSSGTGCEGSSGDCSSSSSSRHVNRQVLVGVRFRPVAVSPISSRPGASPSTVSTGVPPGGSAGAPPGPSPGTSPTLKHITNPQPVCGASGASQSAEGSSGEGGEVLSSTSSLASLCEGAPGSLSRSVRRPPWARRGPADADWALREGEADGWVLAAPWALDLGPRRGPPQDGGPSCGVGRQGGPQRIWDGFKDVCFEADCVFPPQASNAGVYARLVKGLVAAALGGLNAAVLAYGQTASGKTHTMFGGAPHRGSGRGGPQKGPPRVGEKGIVELALKDIFRERDQRAASDPFSVSLSMLEVYQETVTDLLQGAAAGNSGGPAAGGAWDARQKRPIALCERADGTLDMGSLTCRPVSCLAEALSLVQKGEQQRHAAETAANARSSRSHAVLRIVLSPAAAATAGATAAVTAAAAAAGTEAAASAGSSEEGTSADSSGAGVSSRVHRRASVFSLVDLAGSEGAGGAQGNSATQREGGSINRSLLALSKVVKALTQQQQQQQQKQQQHKQDAALITPSGEAEGGVGGSGSLAPGAPRRQAPVYLGLRESKLTRLLSDCLGGPCRTSVICLCAPGATFYRQTAATLAFARRARKLPPAPEIPGSQGAQRSKKVRIRAPGSDAAAPQAAAPASGAAAGAGSGSLSSDSLRDGAQGAPQGTSSGGLPRPFVYIPTGCLQCRALYKALQETREELACQAVQLRQLRYVISRGLPAAAAASVPASSSTSSSSSGSGRGDTANIESTPRRNAVRDKGLEGGLQGGPKGPTVHSKENETPTRQPAVTNYGGGVCYKPPNEASVGTPVGSWGPFVGLLSPDKPS